MNRLESLCCLIDVYRIIHVQPRVLTRFSRLSLVIANQSITALASRLERQSNVGEERFTVLKGIVGKAGAPRSHVIFPSHVTEPRKNVPNMNVFGGFLKSHNVSRISDRFSIYEEPSYQDQRSNLV